MTLGGYAHKIPLETKIFHKFPWKSGLIPEKLWSIEFIDFMALFLSTFVNKIDSKGRVSVPAQFRAALTNKDFSGIVVYESFINQCIEGCDIQRITKLSESIDNLDPFSEERDAFATTILGGAMQLSIDGDGRVILPESLIEKSEISEKALFVGKGPTFEVWNPGKFDEYLIQAKQHAKDKRNLLRLNQNKF